MKARLLALMVVASLPLMAFNCITDSFTIALNLKPFNGTVRLNPGGNTGTYGGFFTVSPDSMFDSNTYALDGASVYDVTVGTAGPDLGAVHGTVTVNGTLLLTYNGTWNDFLVPQSLINSPHITRNAPGVQVLINSVVKGTPITFAVAGTETVKPVPTGCSLVSSAYVQAYGHKK